MKSFECESSSEGDEPTIQPISRGIAEAPQWLRGSATVTSWGWHTPCNTANEGPSSSAVSTMEQPFTPFSHNSNEESPVPGRRTPLGNVGLSGFYFPGVCAPNLAGHANVSDENNPEPGVSCRSQAGRSLPNSHNSAPNKMKNRQGKAVRLNINARERRRMHDLNDALDELRAVIPYAHSPSVRKLSKLPLFFSKNYILMQANALDELRRLVAYLQGSTVGASIVPPPGFALDGFPAAAKFLQQHHGMPNENSGSERNSGGNPDASL